MKQTKATVVSKGEPIQGLYRPHGRSIKFSQTIRLHCPEIAQEARPGQFVMLNCGEDCVLPRPFSIHQVIDKEDVALYFAVVGVSLDNTLDLWLKDGKGTNWLSQRKVGDKIAVIGTLGNGFTIQTGSRNLLLVAGGMGIASLYFLAQETVKQGYSVTLLYGTAIENPYPGDHLTSGIKLVTATEDGSVGEKGKVTDLIPKYVDWADQIFACGPLPMYRDMALRKQELNLKGKLIQVSLEVRMGCGRGLCNGCTIKTKRGLKKVCADGPVFELDDLLWDELNL